MSFNELKKNLWEIVDNEKTNDRVKIKAIKQLSEITVQALDLIPIAVTINMIQEVDENLKEREKVSWQMKKFLKHIEMEQNYHGKN